VEAEAISDHKLIQQLEVAELRYVESQEVTKHTALVSIYGNNHEAPRVSSLPGDQAHPDRAQER
jgi:hypothetical protein